MVHIALKRGQRRSTILPFLSLVNDLRTGKTTRIPALSHRYNVRAAGDPKQQVQNEAIETRKIGMAASLYHLLVCPRKLSVIRLEWPFKHAEIIEGSKD